MTAGHGFPSSGERKAMPNGGDEHELRPSASERTGCDGDGRHMEIIYRRQTVARDP